MWTKRSNWLLVHIKSRGKPGFYIPLPLAVADVTLASWRDGVAFWEALFPNLLPNLCGHKRDDSGTGSRPRFAELVDLVTALINELRSYGKYELVRAEARDSEISIRFY